MLSKNSKHIIVSLGSGKKKKWAERFTEEVLFPKAVCQNTAVSYLECNFCVLMSSIFEQSNFSQITLFS